jgi:hypothetical protein
MANLEFRQPKWTKIEIAQHVGGRNSGKRVKWAIKYPHSKFGSLALYLVKNFGLKFIEFR